MSDEDQRLLIDLLVEQAALRLQMNELNTEALKDKLGVTQHQIYRIKSANLPQIMARAKRLAMDKRAG